MRRRTIGLRDVSPVLRGAALMPVAALAVHQLRYKLAFGGGSSHMLAAQGHAYLAGLAPWIVLLAGLSVGASLGRLAHRWARGAAEGTSRRAAGLGVWLLAAFALVAIYTGQELLEGLLATGHPGGLAGVFGDGGWWAMPVALVVGGALALALRGAQALERALAGVRLTAPARVRAAAEIVRRGVAPSLLACAPLARLAAGRAPPRRSAALA